MKKIFVLLGIMVALTTGANATQILDANQYVVIPIPKPLDSSGLPGLPDSAHVFTYGGGGTAAAYLARSTTYPFSDISMDTTKTYGDTCYWFVDQVQDIDGAGGQSTLAIIVTLWYKKVPTSIREIVQIVSDSLTEDLNFIKDIRDTTQNYDNWIAQQTEVANLNGWTPPDSFTLDMSNFNAALDDDTTLITWLRAAAVGGVATLSDADMAAIIDTLFGRGVADTVNGKLLSYWTYWIKACLDTLQSQDGWIASAPNLIKVIDTVNAILDTAQNQDNWIPKAADLATKYELATTMRDTMNLAIDLGTGTDTAMVTFLRLAAAGGTDTWSTTERDSVLNVIADIGKMGRARDSINAILDTMLNKNNWGFATSAAIAALHDFDPTTDKVYLGPGEYTKINDSTWLIGTRALTAFSFLVALAAGEYTQINDTTWGVGSRSLTVFDEDATSIDINGTPTGAAASVTAGVTVTTNNDKDGYALAPDGVDRDTSFSQVQQAVLDALDSLGQVMDSLRHVLDSLEAQAVWAAKQVEVDGLDGWNPITDNDSLVIDKSSADFSTFDPTSDSVIIDVSANLVFADTVANRVLEDSAHYQGAAAGVTDESVAQAVTDSIRNGGIFATIVEIWEADTSTINAGMGQMLKDTSAYQGSASGLDSSTVANIVKYFVWRNADTTHIDSSDIGKWLVNNLAGGADTAAIMYALYHRLVSDTVTNTFQSFIARTLDAAHDTILVVQDSVDSYQTEAATLAELAGVVLDSFAARGYDLDSGTVANIVKYFVWRNIDSAHVDTSGLGVWLVHNLSGTSGLTSSEIADTFYNRAAGVFADAFYHEIAIRADSGVASSIDTAQIRQMMMNLLVSDTVTGKLFAQLMRYQDDIRDTVNTVVTPGGYVRMDADSATGTFDAAQFGTDFITATKIAADAIGLSELGSGCISSDEFGSSAAQEITDSLFRQLISDTTTGGFFATVLRYLVNVRDTANAMIVDIAGLSTFDPAIDSILVKMGAFNGALDDDTTLINWLRAAAVGGVATLSDADMAAIIDTFYNRSVSDTVNGALWSDLARRIRTYLDVAVSSIGSGSGAYTLTVFVVDTSVAPDDTLSNIRVVIQNQTGVAITGELITGSGGSAVFNVPADSCRVVAYGGATYTFGVTGLTVAANDTIVVRGYTTTVSSPIDPDLSLVYGTAKNFRGVASQGLVISAKRKSGVAVDTSGTFIIGPQYQFDTTDANGFFSFELIRTALYKDTTEGLYTITGTYRTTVIFTVDSVRVPDSGNLDISTLID